MPPLTVAVIEPDAAIRAEMREAFARAGIDVEEAEGGRAGLRTVYATRPAAVLLCLRMNDLDGFETLERIRSVTDVPVMIVSAVDDPQAKLRAFDRGADDYVTKPFNADEVVARVRALLRRSDGRHTTKERYADRHLQVDFDTIEARGPEGPLDLTALQFRLLAALVRHANQPLTREQLLTLAWTGEAFDPERVKLHVSNLRRKLGEAGVPPTAIETVRGFGYRYRPAR